MTRVVFGKMSPHETLFVPSTAQPTLRLVANSDLVHFSIFDVPGDRDLSELRWRDAQMTPRDLFGRCVVLAYVRVDAEADPYSECAFATRGGRRRGQSGQSPVQLEVFVHKVDGDHFLSEEQKLDCRREVGPVRARSWPELYAHGSDETVDPQQAQAYADDCLAGAAFSLTSIYDHSVFEAFSKLVSRALVPQRIVLRKMLDALVTACDMEKSFLFDVASKFTWPRIRHRSIRPRTSCVRDAIDVVLDVASIYAPDKTQQPEPSDGEEPTRGGAEANKVQCRVDPTRTAWRWCWTRSTGTWRWSALLQDGGHREAGPHRLQPRLLPDDLGRLAALNASSAGK